MDVGLLLAREPHALTAAARGLDDDAAALRDAQAGVRRAVGAPRAGVGRTADALQLTGEQVVVAVGAVADATELDARVLHALATALAAALALLQRALGLAAGAGLRVDAHGTATAAPGVDDVLAPSCTALAREALASAEEAERDAATALRREPLHADALTRVFPGLPTWAGDDGLVAAVTARAAPADAAPPVEVLAWWSGRPAAERARLRATGSAALARDGMPVAERDAANRVRLHRELAALEHRLRQGRSGDAPWSVVRSHAVLRRVAGVLAATPGATLLHLGTRLPGRAVVGVGDVERADHLAVLVPGFTGRVEGYLGRLVGAAQDVQGLAGAYAARLGGGTVAAVAWIGYETPGLLAVAGEGRAREAAPVLRRSLEGLRAVAVADGTDPHLTLLGHSYGSLVAATAVRVPTAVDDLVLLASPGAGVAHAGQLAVPAVHVSEARWDPVADVGWFGDDPGDAAFGAHRLPAGQGVDPVLGTPTRPSTGHSQHYAEGSTSLSGLSLVVAGRPDLVGVRP